MSQSFVQDILLPYFHGFSQSDVDVTLYSPDSRILAISQNTPRTLQIDWQEFIGVSLKEISPEIILRICDTQPSEVDLVIRQFAEIVRLNDIIVAEKVAINYIDIIPYKNFFESFLVVKFPVFDTQGNVVAIQSLATKFYFFGMADYLSSIEKKEKFTRPQNVYKKTVKIDLTNRQHEILFLLLCGMTQTDIATFLELKRGTISTVVNHLCQKFNIEGANTSLLLKAARKRGVSESIPPTLKQPRIIILNPQLRAKYFFKS